MDERSVISEGREGHVLSYLGYDLPECHTAIVRPYSQR